MYLLSWFAIPYVNDLCNDDRNDQVKYNLQKFKKMAQGCFLFCSFFK